MASLATLVAAEAPAPDPSGPSVRVDRIIAVVEGQARTATAPAAVQVVLAPADGDSSIVVIAEQVLAGAEVPLVVTADRGLRARLPAGSEVTGPSWLLRLI
jgi:hypothetical protein